MVISIALNLKLNININFTFSLSDFSKLIIVNISKRYNYTVYRSIFFRFSANKMGLNLDQITRYFL